MNKFDDNEVVVNKLKIKKLYYLKFNTPFKDKDSSEIDLSSYSSEFPGIPVQIIDEISDLDFLTNKGK